MKRVVIVPQFIDQVCPDERLRKPAELESYRNQRKVIAAKNAAIYYTALYQAIYGGVIHHCSNGANQYETELDPFEVQSDGFHPDIVGKCGTDYLFTEVKTSHVDGNRFWSAIPQFRNYSQEVLHRKTPRKNPFFQYALFRYGRRHESGLYLGSAKLGHEQDHRSLVEKLSHETNELILLPMNLMMAIFSTGVSAGFYQRKSRDHSTSNTTRSSEDYFVLYGGIMSKLIKMARKKTDLNDFLDKLRDPDITQSRNPEVFCLDGIRIHRRKSPRNLFCRSSIDLGEFCVEAPIEQFDIVEFFMDESLKRKFLKNFKEHHKDMFDWMRIQALDEVPF